MTRPTPSADGIPTSKLESLDAPTRDALRLSLVPGIGPRIWRRLIDVFGSPTAALQAAPAEIRAIPGIGTTLTRAILQAGESIDIDDEVERCHHHAIRLIPRNASTYPSRLAEIEDPPSLLYCRGTVEPVDELAIAIVGTRHASPYGLRQAERFARGLAMAGFTIVSGMARGIDTAAHRGAMAVGGRTLAVLGSGLLNVYPPENGELSLEIASHGAVLSEYPTLQPPRSGAFPQRNRLVTGLSLGVLIVEAAQRSGALISARLAGEQGREVFALPGPLESRTSAGCHQLIRDGATLVTSVDDVIEGLGPLATPRQLQTADGRQETLHRPSELKLNEVETAVLQTIPDHPIGLDELVDLCELSVPALLSTVSVLETRHLIRRVVGGKVVRQ